MAPTRTDDAPFAPEGGRGLRILVVEDHPDCAASLSMLLRMHGHEVTVAADGPAALAAARESRPDVVLLDIGLPGEMDGWEVARRLKELPGPKQPLLVAVTGFGQDDDRLHSKQSGIDLHLTKPADPQFLSELLRRFRGIIAG